MKLPACLAVASLTFASHAHAQLSATFVEGAPKDRLVLEHTGDCTFGPAQLALDLTDTAGKLVFDVTAEGAGVEVFQPLEVETGLDALTDTPQVRDGDSRLLVNVAALTGNARIVLSFDLDDTIGAREITVARSEFAGARISLNGSDAAQFDTSARPTAQLATCSS